MMGTGVAAAVVAGKAYENGRCANDASTSLAAMVARSGELLLPDLSKAASCQEGQ